MKKNCYVSEGIENLFFMKKKQINWWPYQAFKSLESFGLIMWEMKKYCLESRSREISYMKYVNERRTGLVTFCVETAFCNGLLKERYKEGQKWQEDKEEDVGSYWMTLRKGEDTLIWRRKLWIALCEELALEEVLDLSQGRLLNEYHLKTLSYKYPLKKSRVHTSNMLWWLSSKRNSFITFIHYLCDTMLGRTLIHIYGTLMISALS
jgi:hypothetical protein